MIPTRPVTFSDAERHHINAFYEHRKEVLRRIESAIKCEKEEKRKRR